MDFKCWKSNTDELEEKSRLRFEEVLLCKLDLYPSGRLSDQRWRELLTPMNLFRVTVRQLCCDEQWGIKADPWGCHPSKQKGLLWTSEPWTFLSSFLLFFFPFSFTDAQRSLTFQQTAGDCQVSKWLKSHSNHLHPPLLPGFTRSFICPGSSKSSMGDWLSCEVRMIKSDQSHCLPLWPTSSLLSHLQHLILNRKCSINFDHWCIQDSLKGQHGFHLSSSQATLLLLPPGKIRLQLITSVSCNRVKMLPERQASRRESQGTFQQGHELFPSLSMSARKVWHELWLLVHREVPERFS